MTKIAMIGAGSTVFMKNILTDILLEEPYLQAVNLRFRTLIPNVWPPQSWLPNG